MTARRSYELQRSLRNVTHPMHLVIPMTLSNGIGGGHFYMAENFNVDVVGIDLFVNMIFALEQAIRLKCSVEFEVADCTIQYYLNNSFDVIYSRDTILHIQDKPALFRTFYKWLKQGGKNLFIPSSTTTTHHFIRKNIEPKWMVCIRPEMVAG